MKLAQLTEDWGITRVAVLYQDDSFGLNGLEGTRLALECRGLKPVAASHYPRNTRAVKGAALKITAAKPEAVIMIGSYMPLGIVRFALEDIEIDDILDRSRRHPAPSVTVRDFTEQWIGPHQPHYVVADKEVLVGIVSLEMLRYLPKDAWGKTQLDAVVRRQTPLAWPDEQVEDVLHRMSENSLSVMPVVERDSEKFLGAVTSSDIIQLMTMETMGERPPHRPVKTSTRSRQNH